MNFKKTSLLYILTAFLMGAVSCSEKPEEQKPVGDPNEKPDASYVFYEANPRVFATTNQLNAITARLENIQDLGVDVIWLMPICEQVWYP